MSMTSMAIRQRYAPTQESQTPNTVITGQDMLASHEIANPHR